MNDKKSSYDMQLDNDRVRVTHWHLGANGGETGHHRHEYDYVIVPVTGGVLTITDSDGVKEAPLTAGETYFRQAGVEHNVANHTGQNIVFIEVEIK